jgi:hypothetical protein
LHPFSSELSTWVLPGGRTIRLKQEAMVWQTMVWQTMADRQGRRPGQFSLLQT